MWWNIFPTPHQNNDRNTGLPIKKRIDALRPLGRFFYTRAVCAFPLKGWGSMYHRVLIANRADCASRLIDACHALEIQTVLIAARDETARLALEKSDRVVFTGFSRDAYTNPDNILEAAHAECCEAILPGWGFLSEDFAFSRRARLMGLDFVGPSSRHLQIFGDKLDTLERLLPRFGLPLRAKRADDPEILDFLSQSAGPWMLKGRFGGGGKSIARYDDRAALLARIAQAAARHEAHLDFVEPAVDGARHIEFQVFGDGAGRARVLGIRDCTAQVHHQKWLEYHLEPNTPTLRRLTENIETTFSELRYQGWGTVEFLVTRDQAFHLLEVNPRLQVEHGVTEMARQVDLVAAALELSCHGRVDWDVLDSAMDEPRPHDVLEFRLFARGTGRLDLGFEGCRWPDHPMRDDPAHRLETGYDTGNDITGTYDGLIARFLVRTSKGGAVGAMKSWLRTFHCRGLETNLDDLLALPDTLVMPE